MILLENSEININFWHVRYKTFDFYSSVFYEEDTLSFERSEGRPATK